MKPRTQIILAGALLIALMAWSSARRGPRSNNAGQSCGTCCPFLSAPGALPLPSATNGTTTNAPSQLVIAYYFHGTVRCETCLKIEQQAKSVIERQFKPELDAQRLVFIPLNYDLPENAHFLLDYKLPCPSLVLVGQKDGKDVQRTLLGDTWQLVGEPAKFNSYIETEVNKFLSDPK
ncbi:MAG TPA: nitrophenyl compound nitroreductase subunit ArsF family protein [Verrucomicrobiae bacterium]